MLLNPRKACSAAGWMDTDYFDCMGWNDDPSGVKIELSKLSINENHVGR